MMKVYKINNYNYDLTIEDVNDIFLFFWEFFVLFAVQVWSN